MGDGTAFAGGHEDGRSRLTRRQIVARGGMLAAAGFGAPVLRFAVDGAEAAPARQDPEIPLSPEAAAYYTPDRFEGGELRVVVNASFLSTPASQEVMESRLAGFNEATGSRVQYVPLPENQMYDQVRLELANATGAYDMMHSGAGGAKDYGLSGFLVPLPTPPDLDDFYEADVAQYSIGGELFGLPMIADTNILYWRADLFEQAGLDPDQPPRTYEEFREYAVRLTTDGAGLHPGDEGFDPDSIDVFGSAFKGTAGLACTWEWYNYLYAFGGDLVDADYNPTLDSPESVASLQWVVDNLNDSRIYPPDILTYDYTEYHTLFIQGRMAMAINWPYMWSLIQDPEQSKVVDLVRVGRKPGQETHGGNIGGWSWNVFEMSANQELAIAFAKWMSAPETSLAFARADLPPVRKSVAEIKADEDPVLFGAISENLTDGRGVKWLDTGPSWMEIEKVQYEAIQRALIGDVDPETALADANRAVREILEQNRFYDEILPQLQG